jgi:hypothetical protein
MASVSCLYVLTGVNLTYLSSVCSVCFTVNWSAIVNREEGNEISDMRDYQLSLCALSRACTTRGTLFHESEKTQDCNEYWQSQWPLWVSVV